MSKLKLKNIKRTHTFINRWSCFYQFHTDMSLTNMVKEKYGEIESETKISSEQILSKYKNLSIR